MDDDEVWRDDNDRPSIAVYYVLFLLFIMLWFFGVWLFVRMFNRKKINKQICAFYISSLLVVTFRVLLFADPFAQWPKNLYLIGLVSLPSYLYLMVGLSQLLLIVESILGYRKTLVLMNRQLDRDRRELLLKRQRCILSTFYSFIVFATVGIIFLFVYYIFKSRAAGWNADSMFGALTLGILNIILWALLLASSLYFFKMLNQRFGEKFKSAKLHLKIVMLFFSISFLIRSLWDIIIPTTNYNPPPKTNATVIFFFYMLTEYLPIASIYLTHAYAFYRLSLAKSKKKLKKSKTE